MKLSIYIKYAFLFVFIILSYYIFCNYKFNMPNKNNIKENILKSEYGGRYIFFKDYKDLRKYYIENSNISVPESGYDLSCDRNSDGTLLFMVETDKKQHFTIKSCAVFQKDYLLKSFDGLNIQFSNPRFGMTPPSIFHLFNTLGYPISEFTPGDINYKNYSRFGMYYYEESEVKGADDSSTITLYSKMEDRKICSLKLLSNYRLTQVLEIQNGIMVIYVNEENSKLIINRINTKDKMEIRINQYNIPDSTWGFTSLSIKEYNPKGNEIILYAGQDFPLRGSLFLLDTVKDKIIFLTRLYYLKIIYSKE